MHWAGKQFCYITVTVVIVALLMAVAQSAMVAIEKQKRNTGNTH